ncbi:hypothetical protein BVG19_g124 [[Candida] boidinii]|nr:hypothetical protein BVG19_g124 [[Candida] boidinii]OWB49692.1 hypothetical protein B5S27_g1234 [[Candida] boidinii]
MKATIFLVLIAFLRRSALIVASEIHELSVSNDSALPSSLSSPCSSVLFSSSTFSTSAISLSTTVSTESSIPKTHTTNSTSESILANSHNNSKLISQNPDSSPHPSLPSQLQQEQNQDYHTISSTNKILDFSRTDTENSDSQNQESERENVSTHINASVYTAIQSKDEPAILENSFSSNISSLESSSDPDSQASSALQNLISSSSVSIIPSADSVSKSSHSIEAPDIEIASREDISSQKFSTVSSSTFFSEIKSSILSSNPPNYSSSSSFGQPNTGIEPTTKKTELSETKNTERHMGDIQQETARIESPESLIRHPNIKDRKGVGELDADSDPENDKAYFMSFEEWKKVKVDQNEIHNIKQKSSRSIDKNIDESQNFPQELSDHLNGPIGDDMELDISMFGVAPKDLEGKIYKDRFNYASFDCAATIIKTNSKAKKASAILNENKDSYLLNECSVPNKFVIIELCEDILVDEVAIANYEFFSSGFKKLRFSVSGKFPIPANGWKVLGEFNAKNSRDLQKFSIKNPFIWARYFRVEILSHYGTEYFCPISTIQVHGKTMMEKFKMEEEEQIGDLIDIESTDSKNIIEGGLVEGEDQHILQGHTEDIDKSNEVTGNIGILDTNNGVDKNVNHIKTNRKTGDAISVGYPTSKSQVEILNQIVSSRPESSNKFTPNSTELAKGTDPDHTDGSSDTIKNSDDAQKVKIDPSNLGKIARDNSKIESKNNETSEKESEAGKKKYQLELLDVKELNDACSVNITFMEISQFFKYRVNDLCIPDKEYYESENFTNAEITDKASTGNIVGGMNNSSQSNTQETNNNTSTVIGNTKNANSKIKSSRPNNNNYGDEPTTQESIYRNIIKRISMLETNATLSLLYIEEQSKILSKAFESLENRQKTKFDILVSALNSTFHDRIQKLLSINEDMSTEYRLQQIKLNHQTETRLYHLNSELVFQKKMVLFNSILIVCLLVYVIVSRDTYIETEITDGYYGNDYGADKYNDNRSLSGASNVGKHSRANSGDNSDASFVSSDYNPLSERYNGHKGGGLYSYDYNGNGDIESEFVDQHQYTGDIPSNPTSPEDYTYDDSSFTDHESAKAVRFAQRKTYSDNTQNSLDNREAVPTLGNLGGLSNSPVKTKVLRVSLGHKLFSPVSSLSQTKYYSRFFSPSKDSKKKIFNHGAPNENSVKVDIHQNDDRVTENHRSNSTEEIACDPPDRINSESDDSYQFQESISSNSKDKSKLKGSNSETETDLKPHNLGNSHLTAEGIIDDTETNGYTETKGSLKDDSPSIGRKDRTHIRTSNNSSKASLVRLRLDDLKSEIQTSSASLISKQDLNSGELNKEISNKIYSGSGDPVDFGISNVNVQFIEGNEGSADSDDEP